MGFLDAKFERLAQLLPVTVANYTKRFMERVYDNAFQTELGQRLAAMGKSKKYAVEFGLNLLTAFFEDRLAENTKLKKFLKEVSIDAAPEISKRMINGVKEEVRISARTDEEKELAMILLMLEDRELTDLLNWLYEKPADELKMIFGQLILMSAEQIARLMRLSEIEREKFFDLLSLEKRQKKTGQESREPTFYQVLRQDMAEGAKRLNEIADQMRERRKGERR